MSVLYTGVASATGNGRGGRVGGPDGVLDLDLAVPKELGGPGGPFTNPEQLFAAGYAACFHDALKLMAERLALELDRSVVTSEVGIGGPDGAGDPGLEIRLTVEISGINQAMAEALVA